MRTLIRRAQATGTGAIAGAGIACMALAFVSLLPVTLSNDVIGAAAMSFAGIGGLLNGTLGR
ncbi:MAG: hypothetical protein GVY13_04440 [Alphaproteobacteria bacterium]|nr:hypothetical protein [Alphaproteobacteria bacterium]